MKALRIITGLLLAIPGTYLIAFFVLGWLSPYNMVVNRFYSSAFYGLRVIMESKYLNKLEQHQGVLRFSTSGAPAILKSEGTGVGFEVPEELRATVAAIPDGTEVIGYVGLRLSRESVGLYHNQLRKIEIKRT